MKILKVLKQLMVAGFILSLSACNKEVAVPYDNPFFYIHVNNSSLVRIQADRNQLVEYKVYLSSKLQFEPINLQYSVVPGDGLKEGVDYEVVTQGRTLLFNPGVTERSVSIKWISNPIDPGKDNYLRIHLLSSDKNIGIGLPGPDKLQSTLNILKF